MSSAPNFENVLKAIHQTEGGQEFLRWLIVDTCGCLRSPMAADEGDIRYLCGKQDIGYVLLDLLLATQPQALAKLVEPQS